MASAYTVAFVIASALVGSINAVERCDTEGIVAKFKDIPECYKGGVVPPLTAYGGLATHIWMSEGELLPNTHCVTAIQSPGSALVTFYDSNNKGTPYTFTQQPIEEKGYISETDPLKRTYRLYVIHNESKVYSYYRCTDGTTEGTGTPMGDIAVGCKQDPDSDRVIKDAKKCFEKVGIMNLKPVPPCNC